MGCLESVRTHEAVIFVDHPWLFEFPPLERAEDFKASDRYSPAAVASRQARVFGKHGRSQAAAFARPMGSEMENLTSQKSRPGSRILATKATRIATRRCLK